jgi:2-polyprenyl-3-methyl-5-hydroxy-6-metoxy-1,4-benzoquinol methylase
MNSNTQSIVSSSSREEEGAQICPLCNSVGAKTIRIESDGTLVRCHRCSFMYVYPRPTEEELKLLYDDEYFSGEDLSKCLDFRKPVFQQCLATLKSLSVGQGRLLDVGCATGEFVLEAISWGWQAEGIESSRTAADFARTQKELPVHNADLESAPFPKNTFDVVTLLDVLEHLLHPREEMQRVHSLLRSGGIAVVRVPNTLFHLPKSRLCSALGVNDMGLWMRYHLNHFTPKTLRAMLTEVGFKVLSVDVGAPETKVHAPWAGLGAKRMYVRTANLLQRVTRINVGNIIVAYGQRIG